MLLSAEEITQKANKLQKLYNDDLEKSFACEYVHYRARKHRPKTIYDN